ncbi:hypothetical protein Hanom_Chr10g00932641 [Helianthus anomalus]
MGACEMASFVWPLRARHVTLLARPTPDFKPKPQGPRPNPSPRGGDLGVSPNPRHNPRPIPHSLSLYCLIQTSLNPPRCGRGHKTVLPTLWNVGRET